MPPVFSSKQLNDALSEAIDNFDYDTIEEILTSCGEKNLNFCLNSIFVKYKSGECHDEEKKRCEEIIKLALEKSNLTLYQLCDNNMYLLPRLIKIDTLFDYFLKYRKKDLVECLVMSDQIGLFNKVLELDPNLYDDENFSESALFNAAIRSNAAEMIDFFLSKKKCVPDNVSFVADLESRFNKEKLDRILVLMLKNGADIKEFEARGYSNIVEFALKNNLHKFLQEVVLKRENYGDLLEQAVAGLSFRSFGLVNATEAITVILEAGFKLPDIFSLETAIRESLAAGTVRATGAARNNRLDVVTCLLRFGADPNIQGERGQDLLSIAAGNRESLITKEKKEIVRLLIIYGAKLGVQNDFSPIRWIATLGDEDLMSLTVDKLARDRATHLLQTKTECEGVALTPFEAIDAEINEQREILGDPDSSDEQKAFNKERIVALEKNKEIIGKALGAKPLGARRLAGFGRVF